jgi:hypothetical protein
VTGITAVTGGGSRRTGATIVLRKICETISSLEIIAADDHEIISSLEIITANDLNYLLLIWTIYIIVQLLLTTTNIQISNFGILQYFGGRVTVMVDSGGGHGSR